MAVATAGSWLRRLPLLEPLRHNYLWDESCMREIRVDDAELVTLAEREIAVSRTTP